MKILLFIIVISYGNLFANIIPTGYTIETIGIRGINNTTYITSSGVSSGNPASLINHEKISIGITGQHESSMEYDLYSTGYSSLRNKRVQSIGIIIPKNDWKFGLGFNHNYNIVFDFGEVEVSNIDGETFTDNLIYNIQIKKYSIIVSKEWIVNKKNKISFGWRFNAYYYDSIVGPKTHPPNRGSDSSIGYAFGIQIITIGGFESGLLFESDTKFKYVSSNSISQVNGDGNYQSPEPTVEWTPNKYAIGLRYRLNSMISYNLEIGLTVLDESYSPKQNFLDLSGDIVFAPFEKFIFSLGILNIQSSIDRDGISEHYDGKYSAVYFIGGLQFNFYGTELTYNYCNSKKFSGDWRQQYINKLSLTYTF
jgi:hypothetical protein